MTSSGSDREILTVNLPFSWDTTAGCCSGMRLDRVIRIMESSSTNSFSITTSVLPLGIMPEPMDLPWFILIWSTVIEEAAILPSLSMVTLPLNISSPWAKEEFCRKRIPVPVTPDVKEETSGVCVPITLMELLEILNIPSTIRSPAIVVAPKIALPSDLNTLLIVRSYEERRPEILASVTVTPVTETPEVSKLTSGVRSKEAEPEASRVEGSVS